MAEFIFFLQQQPRLSLCLIALFSLMVGSLLNVIIHRLPIMMFIDMYQECQSFIANNPTAEHELPKQPFNLFIPRSRCPACQQMIASRDNIPVISYILLKGRCRYCQTPIKRRYPLIELLTALLSVVVVYQLGFNLAALAALIFTWSIISLAGIDIDHQILPDAMTYPLLWLGLLLSLNHTFVSPHAAILGASIGYLSLWSLATLFKLITGKIGMGNGDFKCLAMLGAWLGWQSLPLIILLSSFIGILVWILLYVSGRLSGDTAIPFGPYLAAAGWISLLWGDTIIHNYLHALGRF